ncbi:hypothetical protein [Cryomorpha ignava]|uniref:hypothetical protein n=1 Tax=Cryomorpha ignava TaxID=101383 RepID=UPI001952AD7B|nr:hypothetical protein [Cryomorpha ignava]
MFGKDKRPISEHIRNMFKEGELKENMVVRKFRTTTQHGAIPEKTQEHVKNFFIEKELEADRISWNFRTVQTEGSSTVEREIEH